MRKPAVSAVGLPLPRDRTCLVCGVIAYPVVIVPGSECDRATLWAIDEAKAVDTFVIRRPIADICYCSIACAQSDGWPWLTSERPRATPQSALAG